MNNLRRKKSFELEEGMLVYVKIVFEEEHKKKMEENVKLVALAGKLS